MADILRCVVSTVGTSLLTNPATPEERKRLLALANTSDDNLEPDDQALIARLADAAGRALAG